MIIFGGDIFVWLEQGDINVGCGLCMILLYMLLCCVYDGWGNVILLLQVLVSGVGIVILNFIVEVLLGDVDLIVLLGIIDVGEVGICVFGNINLVVLQVFNVVNIQVQGESKGLLVLVLVNVNVLVVVSVVVNSVSQVVQDVMCKSQDDVWCNQLLVISVQILGFGSGISSIKLLVFGNIVNSGYDVNSVFQFLQVSCDEGIQCCQVLSDFGRC